MYFSVRSRTSELILFRMTDAPACIKIYKYSVMHYTTPSKAVSLFKQAREKFPQHLVEITKEEFEEAVRFIEQSFKNILNGRPVAWYCLDDDAS